MSTTADLITVLKQELKSSGMTYADLSQSLGMAESSIKRMFARKDMPLTRIDEICQALKLDFAEVARRVANTEVLLQELTDEQEQTIVSDPKLLLVAICVLSQWTMEQLIEEYSLTEPECIKCLAQLDKIGVIELRSGNKYRLMLAKTFRWVPNGPIMRYFRKNAMTDYYSGTFDKSGEGLMLVHGSISKTMSPVFLERMKKLGHDFAQQHKSDKHLPRKDRLGYTLLLGLREWEFSAFTKLRRQV